MKTSYKIIILGIIITTTIFGAYQSLMIQCGTLPVFMETPRQPNLWNCLEIWEHQSEPPQLQRTLPVPEPESHWRITEDHCQDFCDQNESYEHGCNEPIFLYLHKYTNLLDENFDGTYVWNTVGLPDGVSEEKFDKCADFIYQSRISVELENEN